MQGRNWGMDPQWNLLHKSKEYNETKQDDTQDNSDTMCAQLEVLNDNVLKGEPFIRVCYLLNTIHNKTKCIVTL